MVVLMAGAPARRAAHRRALIVVAVAAAFLASAAGFGQTSEERRVIRITAERFSFTPSEIELTEGEEVELRISSDDTSHGFRVLGTSIKVAVPKRGKGDIAVVFKAERAGRYTFECSRMCGAGHDFMRGVLRVRSKEDAGAQ